ncbi:MAG: fumarate reductase subunit C [Hyphomicrobiales bacterium]|nr:fumarate reductase subunit C [Hyphomicrobiales bacterium]
MNPRKPYVRPISKTSWFMTHSRYKHYMLHEISSVFVAIYTIIIIVGLFRLSQGEAAWNGWLAAVASPLGILVHLAIFVFALIHTTAWFKAVPQALRIQRGESIVPGNLIVGAHYGILAAVSLFVLVLAGVA